MTNTPLVSVIMPCYNSERFIAESIDSVIGQSYPNFELLITDDGSTDNSVEIIKNKVEKDNRIKLFILKERKGIAKARNNSLSHAKGRFIAFLDSDDIWTTNKLSTQINFMINNNIGFSYSHYELIDEEGRKKNKIIKNAGTIGYKEYARNTIIGCGTVIIDRDIVGDFRMPIFDTSEDMATWLDIMKKGFKAHPVNEALLLYRVSRDSASSRKFKAAADVWRVYRKNEKMTTIQSVMNFLCYAFNAIKKRIM